jgi:hypothetical protein
MQQSGRVTVKLETETLISKPGASLQIGGTSRAFDMTDQNSSYYRETGKPARIKATMVHVSETDLLKLQRFKNGTASFTTDTGHVYIVSNAATADLGDLANGEVDIEIGGDPADE